MKEPDTICKCIKRNGKPCSYRALPSSPFCGVHRNCTKTNQDNEYILKKKLGSGGFGQVWLLENKNKTGKFLVLKKSLRSDTSEIEKQYKNLEKIASLSIPHVVRPVKLDPEKKFFVMEHLSSMLPLNEIFSKKIPMSPASRKHLADQLVETVTALHKHGIVHHDIKPANIMVDPSNGNMKLIDLGLACKKSECNTDRVFGSLLYFPPELLVRCQPRNTSFVVDAPFTFEEYKAYDQWAVGLVLLFLSDPEYNNAILAYGKKGWVHLRDLYKNKEKTRTLVQGGNQLILKNLHLSKPLHA